jgi:hypothetical protein
MHATCAMWWSVRCFHTRCGVVARPEGSKGTPPTFVIEGLGELVKARLVAETPTFIRISGGTRPCGSGRKSGRCEATLRRLPD